MIFYYTIQCALKQSENQMIIHGSVNKLFFASAGHIQQQEKKKFLKNKTKS